MPAVKTAERLLALRFLAGRYQGGSIPVAAGRTLTVGRAAGCDVHLDEELTSRQHARITWEADSPVIEDLGSTNGTFVNGERVQRRRLVLGDRILIGGNILKLSAPGQGRSAAIGAGDLETVRFESTVLESFPHRTTAMRGQLEEVGLPDLLQLLGTSRKSGLLRVESAGRRAVVRMVSGRVTHCLLDGSPALAPIDVLVEMVQWASGSFELVPAPAEPPPGPALDEAVDALLIEAMRRLDELRK